jgi:hypothetical protein
MSEIENGIHVTGITGIVNGNYGPGAGSNRALEPRNVDVEGVGAAIDQDGSGFEIKDDLAGGSEGHSGEDDFVALLEVDGGEGEMQSGGARIDGDGVSGAEILRERGFKLLGARAGGQPSTLQDVHDGGDFLRTNGGAMKREKGLRRRGYGRELGVGGHDPTFRLEDRFTN